MPAKRPGGSGAPKKDKEAGSGKKTEGKENKQEQEQPPAEEGLKTSEVEDGWVKIAKPEKK